MGIKPETPTDEMTVRELLTELVEELRGEYEPAPFPWVALAVALSITIAGLFASNAINTNALEKARAIGAAATAECAREAPRNR